MPTFLSDPPLGVYLILFGAVIVTGLVWINRRDRNSLIACSVVAVVLLLVILMDRLFESPREESVRRVQEMANAADTRDPGAFVAQVADSVEFQGNSRTTVTREQIRNAGFWNILKQYNVHVAVWDFARSDVKEIDEKTIEIGFMAKGEAEGKPYPVYIRATFARQPDGQMRLTRFGSYHPTNHDEPLPIPNFP